jgi:hypothetical protein
MLPAGKRRMSRLLRSSYSFAGMPGVSSSGESKWGCVDGSGWPYDDDATRPDDDGDWSEVGWESGCGGVLEWSRVPKASMHHDSRARGRRRGQVRGARVPAPSMALVRDAIYPREPRQRPFCGFGESC